MGASFKTVFVGDGWTVTILAPVAALKYLVYHIEVCDLATSQQWKGSIDAYGPITEEYFTAPNTVAISEQARDLTVKFVTEA